MRANDPFVIAFTLRICLGSKRDRHNGRRNTSRHADMEGWDFVSRSSPESANGAEDATHNLAVGGTELWVGWR